MVQHQLEVADVLMKEPTIASIGVNVGQLGNNATGGSNTGRMFVELKPRAERDKSVDEGDRGAAAEAGRGHRHPVVHAEPASDQSRRRRTESDAGRRLYDVTLSGVLRLRPVVMAVSVVLLAVTVYLFVKVPKGFLPSEDQGRFNVNTEGAQGIAFKDMVRHSWRSPMS
jgi:multidrug efflux pump subunit AcrB